MDRKGNKFRELIRTVQLLRSHVQDSLQNRPDPGRELTIGNFRNMHYLAWVYLIYSTFFLLFLYFRKLPVYTKADSFYYAMAIIHSVAWVVSLLFLTFARTINKRISSSPESRFINHVHPITVVLFFYFQLSASLSSLVNSFYTGGMLLYSIHTIAGALLFSFSPLLFISINTIAFALLGGGLLILIGESGQLIHLLASITPFFVASIIVSRLLYRAKLLQLKQKADIEELNASLLADKKRFQSLMENGSDIILLINQEGLIQYESPAHHKTLGNLQMEMVGQSFYDFVHADDVNDVKKGISMIVRESGSHFTLEHRGWNKKLAKWIYLESTLTNLLNDSNLKCIVVNSHDITDRKIAEMEMIRSREAAHQANEAKSRFLAIMSHEIRTPLNSILGMAELLAETNLDEEQKKFVKVFNNAGESLLGIINDILDLSRVEAGVIAHVSEPFRLIEDVVQPVMEMVEPRVIEKGLELKYYLDHLSYNIYRGDARILKQILMNIVGNAIKFTRQGHVIVRVEDHILPEHIGKYITIPRTQNESSLQKGGVIFSVEDTGIGIEPDVIHRVFEPFFQADPAASREFGGTGLGLSISNRFISEIGGQLWVESTPGKGSKFIYYLPMIVDLETAATTFTGDASSIRSSGEEADGVRRNLLRILVAEDSMDNQFLLKAYLKKGEYDLSFCENGLQAVEAFKKKDYDIILMDMQMPVMDGYAAVAEIRKLEASLSRRPIPIVALTAHALKEDEERSHQAGCDEHVTKPVKKKSLIDLLERYRKKL